MPEPTKPNDQLDLETILSEPIPNEGKDVIVEETKTPTIKSPTPEETIESLKAQIAEKDRLVASERERAAKLENEKQTATQTAATATQGAFQARESAIETAINSAKSDLDSIKKQLKTARTEGNIDAEIDLEERLADAKYQLNASLWEKRNFETAKADNEKRAKIEEANRSQPKPGTFSARSQEWIAAHPRFNTDDEYNAQVVASHGLAIKKGYQPDSDAYFEFINARLAKVMPEETDDNPPQRQAQVVSTAAPPSRTSTNQRSGTNGKTIRLSAEQLEAAEYMGMTPAEYAADIIKQEEEKRGR